MNNENFKELKESILFSKGQKFKVYVVNKLRKMERDQKSFFDTISEEKSLDDILSINQVMKEFKTSRKTLYRWREKGLKVYQKSPCSNIRVKRADLLTFLKNTRYDRF
jgi:DNA invertase Pin-like site-specific DNA recombinase